MEIPPVSVSLVPRPFAHPASPEPAIQAQPFGDEPGEDIAGRPRQEVAFRRCGVARFFACRRFVGTFVDRQPPAAVTPDFGDVQTGVDRQLVQRRACYVYLHHEVRGRVASVQLYVALSSDELAQATRITSEIEALVGLEATREVLVFEGRRTRVLDIGVCLLGGAVSVPVLPDLTLSSLTRVWLRAVGS